MSAKDFALFAKNFLRNPTRNASIVPSSRYASEAMLRNIDFSDVNTIVELGSGTGSISERIVQKASPCTKIILVELDGDYADRLNEKFGSRVIVENSSAHLLDSILSKHGVDRADLIVSSLPFDMGCKEILFQSITRQTSQGSILRFFTFMPFVMKKVYRDLPVEKKGFVGRNFPPLWVYGIN